MCSITGLFYEESDESRLWFRVPEVTFRCCDSLELTEISKAVNSQSQFITVKGYGLKSTLGKDTWDRAQERPSASFQLSLPVELQEQP